MNRKCKAGEIASDSTASTDRPRRARLTGWSTCMLSTCTRTEVEEALIIFSCRLSSCAHSSSIASRAIKKICKGTPWSSACSLSSVFSKRGGQQAKTAESHVIKSLIIETDETGSDQNSTAVSYLSFSVPFDPHSPSKLFLLVHLGRSEPS